ncbi:putative phospholipase D [Helianthus annuus]|nr:putative phospholipase D [Helianthus annuus]
MAEDSSQRIVYLHGDLQLHIIEARNLPNMDVFTGHIRRCVTFEACRLPPVT